jgi:hypothetical protein
MEVCLLSLSTLDPPSSISSMGAICAYIQERLLPLIAHIFSNQGLMSVYGRQLPQDKRKLLYVTSSFCSI